MFKKLQFGLGLSAYILYAVIGLLGLAASIVHVVNACSAWMSAEYSLQLGTAVYLFVVAIAGIIVSIVMCSFSGVGIWKVAKKDNSDKPLNYFSTINIVGSSLSVGTSIYGLIFNVFVYQAISAYYVDIAFTVFVLLSHLIIIGCLITALVLKIKENAWIKKGFMLGALLLLFVLHIVSLVVSSKDAIVIIPEIFTLIFTLLVATWIVFYRFGEVNYEETKNLAEIIDENHVTTNETEQKKISFVVKPNASTQNAELGIHYLRQLKQLMDEGLITEEEYQEKRKKYVDWL